MPYCAWLLKGYFDTIPFEIDEAGRVDGLSPFGTFFRLILPLARPGLAVAGFYSFITAFGEVAFASTFMLSDTKYTFAVGLQSFVSEHDAQRHLMAATAVLVAIPVSAFFYLVQKNLVTGLTAGGTKGLTLRRENVRPRCPSDPAAPRPAAPSPTRASMT